MDRTRDNVDFPRLVAVTDRVACALCVDGRIPDSQMIRGGIAFLDTRTQHGEVNSFGHLDQTAKALLAERLEQDARELADMLFVCSTPEIQTSSQVDPFNEGAIVAHRHILAVAGLPNQFIPLANETVAILAAQQLGLISDAQAERLVASSQNETYPDILRIVSSSRRAHH